MTFEEIIAEIPKLSIADKLTLIEAIVQNLRSELVDKNQQDDHIVGVISASQPLPPNWE